MVLVCDIVGVDPVSTRIATVMLSVSEASPREAHRPQADFWLATPSAGCAVERFAQGPFAPLRVTALRCSEWFNNVRYALTAPEVTPLMKYFMPTEKTISCGSVATM